jgi:hypothetical protein
MVFIVVPTEKGLAEAAGVFDGTEAVGKVREVFQSAELAFRIGIVV